MLDDTKVTALLDRARREVDDGLLPAVQVAVAHQGELVVDETFGADPASRFIPFSCTKGIVNGALWRVVGDGLVDLEAPVVEYVAEFGSNDKDQVTVEQVLLHLGGFPYAPLGPRDWGTSAERRRAFARWQLTLTPGETFVYHPTAAHWVVAEIIEAVTGEPYADAIERLVTAPLGLPRLLGIPLDDQAGIRDAVGVGEPATAEELQAVFGVTVDTTLLVPSDVALDSLVSLNHPSARAAGVPGGGGVVRAADLALLYQGYLHNPDELWRPEVLHDATAVVRNTLPDPMGVPARRTRGGMMVCGDDGQGHLRGFGRTASPQAFGHNGAGGQIAFADPLTGLSVCYLTDGLDQHLIREGRRGIAIASLAANLLPD